MRMCVCIHACVCACVRDVFAIYDNNTLPRLIMIRIKIIFLYFIEITHTDDFPSTGTRIVVIKCSNGCLYENKYDLSSFDQRKLLKALVLGSGIVY